MALWKITYVNRVLWIDGVKVQSCLYPGDD